MNIQDIYQKFVNIPNPTEAQSEYADWIKYAEYQLDLEYIEAIFTRADTLNQSVVIRYVPGLENVLDPPVELILS